MLLQEYHELLTRHRELSGVGRVQEKHKENGREKSDTAKAVETIRAKTAVLTVTGRDCSCPAVQLVRIIGCAGPDLINLTQLLR